MLLQKFKLLYIFVLQFQIMLSILENFPVETHFYGTRH